MLVPPFSSNPSELWDLPFVNVHDGKPYKLGRPGNRIPSEAEPKTYGDIVAQYRWHLEAKSLASDKTPCASQTKGQLSRTPVSAEGFRYIGKETDRRWEHGEDIGLLDSHVMEYLPNETARMTTDPDLQREVLKFSIRALAKAAGLSDRTVKGARRGRRLRKSTIDCLLFSA
jgi:hypothetical protein